MPETAVHFCQISLASILHQTFNCKKILSVFIFSFVSLNSNAFIQKLSPDNNSVETIVKDNSPIHIEIDTVLLKDQVYGTIPIRFRSEYDQAFFRKEYSGTKEMYWHDQDGLVENRKVESREVDEVNDDRFIKLTLNTDKMIGKKIKVILEKEENLSRIAAVGAFVPQVIPIIAMNMVTWQPLSFWSTLLRWNYLLLDIDVVHSIRNLAQNQVFSNTDSLFAQCSADFVEGFTTYALLSNHGEPVTDDPDRPTAAEASSNKIKKNAIERSKAETFKLFLRTTPTNRMFDCISSAVASSLKTLRNEDRLYQVFGKWPMLYAMNDETIDGIAMLMVGYGFNIFANVPGGALSLIRRDLGFEYLPDLAGQFNNSIKTSIQYIIHKGYMRFFKGRGWDATSAYALATGVGLLEIGYRFYQVKEMIPAGQDDRLSHLNLSSPGNGDLFDNLQHQITSIGERAEAIASTGYQLIPLPETIKDYVVPVAAATILPIATYYVMNGVLNYYTTGGFNIAWQKAVTSATNGLVLGAMAYILIPYLKDLGAKGTQMLADQLVSWTEADKDSWIGYFAARDTHYSIRVIIIN
ncbi:hypothetical protein [Endozoicomonas sp. SCSIO W0465]|uniref:hypothetical protein n=1 Tax=Endozoicomonas sp. SCSIO W0465 TaxID=2918516 RepID=UPI002075A275|nr:hypothetical protein [Endozoicomonas sp. SCSIO W0465]USE39473.1 hypothetical protein MJO57_15705 [Endozoicomonas sp. SCSIO W0465]